MPFGAVIEQINYPPFYYRKHIIYTISYLQNRTDFSECKKKKSGFLSKGIGSCFLCSQVPISLGKSFTHKCIICIIGVGTYWEGYVVCQLFWLYLARMFSSTDCPKRNINGFIKEGFEFTNSLIKKVIIAITLVIRRELFLGFSLQYFVWKKGHQTQYNLLRRTIIQSKGY